MLSAMLSKMNLFCRFHEIYENYSTQEKGRQQEIVIAALPVPSFQVFSITTSITLWMKCCHKNFAPNVSSINFAENCL